MEPEPRGPLSQSAEAPAASAEASAEAPAEAPAALYADRVRHFDAKVADKTGSVRLFGHLRLATFTTTIIGAWLLFQSGRGTAAWLFMTGGILTFAILVARHRVARRRLHRAELMADFNREGIARIERRWSGLPTAPDLTAREAHDYAAANAHDFAAAKAQAFAATNAHDFAATNAHDYADDLDLYGRASLLRLAGVCGTEPGWKTLQSWLLTPADGDAIVRRQEAVREMAGAYDFRDLLAAEARLMEDGGGVPSREAAATFRHAGAARDVEAFLAWAESDGWLSQRPWLRAAAFVLPAVNVTAIVLYSLGMVPVPALTWPLLISSILIAQGWKRIGLTFGEADDGESSVRRYAPLLGHVASAPLDCEYAASIRHRLGAGSRSAPREISALRRLLDMAQVRESPLFHLPLAVVLLWDVHVLAALERWKTRSGTRVRDWLDAAGEAEALAALAALAADHPDWTFPTIDTAADTVHARALGHPLLAPDVCVPNDVKIGPASSFLFVTGSNMSGKSTLLKAVGLNAALAQAGGPVCADSLTMPPLRVVTSMRVEDSLEDGVSFFMAGLRRLKQVVDAAESAIAPPGVSGHGAGDGHRAGDGRANPTRSAIAPPANSRDQRPPVRTLYLLDEILQGTNSAERRIAARTVLRMLLASGAIGAVTTHDLTLADAEDLVARAIPVHFTESVGRGDEELTFDYRLRAGIATSTNALKLLELVGLGTRP